MPARQAEFKSYQLCDPLQLVTYIEGLIFYSGDSVYIYVI